MKPVIAHYQSTYLKSTENWIATQIGAISGFESIVLTRRIRNPQTFAHPVFSLSELSGFSRQYNRMVWKMIGYAPYFRRVCERENARAIHAWFGFSGVSMLKLARVLELPLITSFLGVDFTRGGVKRLRARYQKLFKQGDAFLAEGPAAASRLIELGAPEAKIVITRIAIDVNRYSVAPRARAPGESMRVLMAARFAEKKGLPDGVEAFCRFLRDGGAGTLTIVGGADDAEGENIARRLHDIAERYQCAHAINFAGWKSHDELVTMLGESDVILHPSVTARDGDAEGGHPVILSEAAASGRAIIATRHCDIPEIVQHDRTGWLIEEHDIDALAAALREAYEMPEKLQTAGQNARRLAEDKYDVRTQSLDSVYSLINL